MRRRRDKRKVMNSMQLNLVCSHIATPVHRQQQSPVTRLIIGSHRNLWLDVFICITPFALQQTWTLHIFQYNVKAVKTTNIRNSWCYLLYVTVSFPLLSPVTTARRREQSPLLRSLSLHFLPSANATVFVSSWKTWTSSVKTKETATGFLSADRRATVARKRSRNDVLYALRRSPSVG